MLPIYLLLLYWWLYRRFVRPAYRRWREIRLRTMSRRVVLLWQFPAAGRVKKNFIPLLGAEGAAHLQLSLYKHTLKTLTKLGEATPSSPAPTTASQSQPRSEATSAAICTEVCWKGADESRVQYWLEREKPPVLWRPQFSGDLCLKLAGAVGGAFREGAQYVVVITRDVPGISESSILEAFDRLSKGSDMVLGPTVRGGYYCIGFNKRAEPHLPFMFLGLEWESRKLLQQQCLIADRIGLKYSVLPEQLTTTDDPSDLPEFERLTGVTQEDLLNPRWTAVISVPSNSTIQQTEAFLVQLIERADNPGNLQVVLVYNDESEVTEKNTENLRQRIRSLGTELESVIAAKDSPEIPTGRYVLCVQLGVSLLPMHWDSVAQRCLARPGVTAGAFRFGSDVNRDPNLKKKATSLLRMKAKVLEWIVNTLSQNFEKPMLGLPIFFHHSTLDFSKELQLSTISSHANMVTRVSSCGHVATTDGEPSLVSYKHCNFEVLIRSVYLSIRQKLGF